jgi:hypothetical protein
VVAFICSVLQTIYCPDYSSEIEEEINESRTFSLLLEENLGKGNERKENSCCMLVLPSGKGRSEMNEACYEC